MLLSVVIVCKNEVNIIRRTLESVKRVADEVLVYDNGSTDGTQLLVTQSGCRLVEGTWQGFGKTKATATMLAKNDWILSLDADEVLDEQLQESIKAIEKQDDRTVFDLQFKNYFGNKLVRYGEWGNDHHIRIFNRKYVNWDTAEVHEGLQIPADCKKILLKGYVLHQTVTDLQEYARKVDQYAFLNARKYAMTGKKSSWMKRRAGGSFAFLKYYFLQLGFLDGWEGYVCAKMTAHYTFLKYARLKEMERPDNFKENLTDV